MGLPYVIFLDIDNTLLWQGTLPERNRQAIARVRREGHLVLLNTARSYFMIECDPLLSTIELDGICCGMGADIRLRGRDVRRDRISPEQIYRVAEYLWSTGREAVLEGEEGVLSIRYDQWIPMAHVDELLTKYKHWHFSKFAFVKPAPAEILAPLRENYEVYEHRSYTEFSIRGHNKATAIRDVMRYLGLDIARSVAMGDSHNDLQMLAVAGKAVAMGDGCQDAKEMADIVSCAASEGGVGNALDILFPY